ncbi:MAG: 2-succinyl-5-enolpyruvyl-6-hydroxy-3-cyclohexene-1-carboxylic-acid synthase [Bacteroidetes bacterium]|nr:MAG: 2-succinyl-5-enolpyruvyl-6-hydroxy-3-cyclohexene-1-carboxylic-acid synthase [Bacteroidota bacterium]
MRTSAKKNVRLLVGQCVEMGLRNVVISPGSRNAPVTVSMNQHPQLNCLVVPDERSAAFFALGMAQQKKEPVAVLCSSGSAAVNFYPAIVEAYYQRIPLVVLTADRPPEWTNEGDGQTIMQQEIFGKHLNYFVQIEDGKDHADYDWYIQREVSRAFQAACQDSRGPVHINISLSEPLYEWTEAESLPSRKFSWSDTRKQMSDQELAFVRERVRSTNKVMILCGQMDPDSSLTEELKKLNQHPAVLVLVENTSNQVDFGFLHCIDRSLNAILEEEKEYFAPELLITMGGALVSKRIKAFLRKHQAREHWKVGMDFPEMDTFQCLSRSFQMEPRHFLMQSRLDEVLANVSSDYGIRWKNKDLQVQDRLPEFLEKHAKWSDLKAFRVVLDCVPEGSILHWANSSVVRYGQLFDPVKSICYRANRGTSGIDGSMSTAVGAAFVEKEKYVNLITGDMSFFYDSNALWNHHLSPNLRIFLINNGGGDIFRIIPGPDSTEEQDQFFVFQNDFEAKKLCEAYRIAYFKADSEEAIIEQMEDFYRYEEGGRPKLMEVFTKDEKNSEQLALFFEKMSV